MQSVSLSLFRFGGLAARSWAFAMMGAARFSLPRVDGIQFWKLCGSGTGEGFTPIPNTAVYAILATWPDLKTAQDRIANASVFQRYRRMAEESWTLHLTPITARGRWSQQAPFEAQDDSGAGPIAALTRATVKPAVAAKFWRRVPDISTVIGADPNVLFKIGIGEVPLLHQITFSVWPDTSSMAHFARKDGPHARAISAVRSENWFREELYARFRVAAESGQWDGQSPRLPLTHPPMEVAP
ncbi:spheroidene monooxygenase [Cognatishimia sp. F0-27]|uniref:spheroidene monooxygenase n=1 Tax=Cognatishimia sp. F0-27 TaxID=2816855 RepID=UPI001D0C72A5|nr:spheroidene monooxygenase [Cognatishimia sp. F0-27]MCC1492437.1 spheroidene monooxygenase [Cognatishimia sp. F0-27]